MKPIVTITMNHVCPMVTGLVPHVGGPIVGPGAPNVLINGKPASVMGDSCICYGPPDVVAQGEPNVLINGTPVVVAGCMTAHGGMIPMGDPTVLVGSATPVKPVTMNIRKIPFPKIRIIDIIGAALSGNSKNLEKAKDNIKKLKEDSIANADLPGIDFSI